MTNHFFNLFFLLFVALDFESTSGCGKKTQTPPPPQESVISVIASVNSSYTTGTKITLDQLNETTFVAHFPEGDVPIQQSEFHVAGAGIYADCGMATGEIGMGFSRLLEIQKQAKISYPNAKQYWVLFATGPRKGFLFKMPKDAIPRAWVAIL